MSNETRDNLQDLTDLRHARLRYDLERADLALEERRRKLVFGTVRAALRWYAETRPRMGAAHGLHPRTEKVDDFGTRVPMHDIDGGPGGDLDELLATLATITDALERLRGYNPTWHRVALLFATGSTQAEIGSEIGQSPRIVSDYMHRAEAFLAGRIGGPDGVLRGCW